MAKSDNLYSLQLERNSLSSLFKHPEIFPEIDGHVSENDYVNSTNRTIFCVARSILTKGDKLDKVIVGQKIKNFGIAIEDDINIFSYLDALANSQITAKGGIDSFKELIKLRIRREITDTAEKIKDFVAVNGELNIDQLVAGTDKLYNEKISHYNIEEEPKDLFGGIADLIRSTGENPVNEIGLITPYGEFNRMFGGVRSGNGLYSVVSRLKHGKACAESTLIPTPDGWTTIGKLKVGDKVFAVDGSITTVVGTVSWENREFYEVATTDGYSVIVDEEHEWLIRPDRRKPNNWKILTTKGIETESNRLQAPRPMMLPKNGELQCPTMDLPIDPYILGLWLGNGHSSGGGFTCMEEDAVNHYIKEAEKRGYDLRKSGLIEFKYHFHNLTSQLRKANLLNNKHIPDVYLRASAKQRRDLLKGLMDTDGHVAKKDGQCEFSTVKENLAESVLELLHTLGINGVIISGEAKLNGKITGPKYRVMFYDNNCVSLPRKAIHQKKKVKKQNRYITVKKLNKLGKTVCIQIDHPSHLYLCGKAMIPTHNSTWLLNMAQGVTMLNEDTVALYLDTEMQTEVNQFRAASAASQAPMWYLETGNWSRNKELSRRVLEVLPNFEKYRHKVYHLNVKNRPIEQICSLIRRFYYKHVGRFSGRRFLVIYDYIKLTGEKLTNNWAEHQAIGEKINYLNDIQNELPNTHLWAAMQLNRSAEDGRDDSSAIAVSDRLQWFAAFVAIFRRKWLDEIGEDGPEFGTHKMIPTATRFQGKDSAGHHDMINISTGKDKPKYANNFINFNIENFQIVEKGTLLDVVNKRKGILRVNYQKVSKDTDSDGEI